MNKMFFINSGTTIFNPSLNISNCFAWWRAESGIVLSGNLVTSWTDIYNGHNLLSSGTLCPYFSASAPSANGRHTLFFNGSNKLLSNENPLIWRFLNNTSGSTVCFCAKPANINTATIYSTYGGTNVPGILFAVGYSGDVYTTIIRDSDNAAHHDIVTHPATGSVMWQTVGISNGLLTTKGSQNNFSTQNINIIQTSSLPPATTLHIGSTDVTDWPYVGCISEIIIYNKVLSELEMVEIGKYFNQKYGCIL